MREEGGQREEGRKEGKEERGNLSYNVVKLIMYLNTKARKCGTTLVTFTKVQFKFTI